MFKVYCFNKVSSTNDKAKGFEIGSVIIANSQVKGKGRFKRSWSSSSGGIYLSIVLESFDASYLTFIGALSACKAIKDVCGLKTLIKWPNDLIYDKKKLCGILTKVDDKAIVGIGINTNNKIPPSLENKAISLNRIIKQEINNKKIINKLLNYFEKYLKLLKSSKNSKNFLGHKKSQNDFFVNKKYSKIINDWKRNSFLGSKVKVKTMGEVYSGIAYDVDKDCFLILKTKGKKIRVVEGDVFVL